MFVKVSFMEYWSDGVLECCKKRRQFFSHYSNTPVLQCSKINRNWMLPPWINPFWVIDPYINIPYLSVNMKNLSYIIIKSIISIDFLIHWLRWSKIYFIVQLIYDMRLQLT